MNTPQKLFFCLLVFFCLSLVACAPTIPPIPTSFPPPTQDSPTLEPTRTPTPINPSLTPKTPSPQQLTVAAQLTRVAFGRETSTARAEIQTANAPTLTPIPTIPTGELLEILEAIRKPEEIWEATSPDGQWVATVINQICADVGPEGTIYEQIKFSRTDHSSGWVLVEEISICGLGYGYYAPIGWSPNSHYFYFASIGVPDGCGFVTGGDPVLQVEMTSHQVTLVSTATDWKISPDQRTLALTSGNELVLWSMDLGEVGRITINTPGNTEFGVWKPDSSVLMVTTAETVYCELPTSSSVVRVDLPGLEQTSLITADTRLLFAAEWLDTGMVVLRRFNYGNQSTWLLNPLTGEITPQQ